MGGGTSKDDNNGAADLEREKALHDLKFKVLILGAGESGKSTVVKQLKLAEGALEEDELSVFKEAIHLNTLQSMQVLIAKAQDYKLNLSGAAQRSAAERILALDCKTDSPKLTPDLAKDVAMLWKDDAIQKTFGKKSQFWILDGAKYYFEQCERFSDEKFIPTNEDVVMARARTTGIIVTDIKSDDIHWQVVDVGGQRSERKKWINCFDDVRAVLFVVNLSGYDTVLFEDQNQKRMHESLNLFLDVGNKEIFKDTPLFVFFNKKDLFEEHIKGKDGVNPVCIDNCFPGYKGDPKDVEASLEFVKQTFISQLESRKESDVMVQYITAREAGQVPSAFQNVKNRICEINAERIADAKARLEAATKGKKK